MTSGFGDLESEVNDLADMASLLATCAERLIDIPLRVVPKREAREIDEDARKMIMFAVYETAHMARQLREKYYQAIENRPTVT